MNYGIVVFPGSNCDHDCYYALNDVLKQNVKFVWHKETNIDDIDCIVLPGGFSYGDYLRTGAIARFSPVMNEVVNHAKRGKLIIGICNGFQVLLESGLLPGAMKRNRDLHFICRYVRCKVENPNTIFTSLMHQDETLKIPIAHGEGNYYADTDTIRQLTDRGQIVFRYCDETGKATDASNPNGSVQNIAGICNQEGNILGMMPHPERCAEESMGSVDGRLIFESITAFSLKAVGS
ncbi:phosphoribosylformylglycinamidine synthase subunit PurQ [PVC group bacterium]|nr:phosphoribosylformylglycinamidine synthase subunit PurQ [PVC group bacterium]